MRPSGSSSTAASGRASRSSGNSPVRAEAFNLNIAGRNLTYGAADFTSPPTLLFEAGELVDVQFAVALAEGSPYAGISAIGGTVTAVVAATNDTITAPLAETGSVNLIFTNVIANNDEVLRTRRLLEAGTLTITVTLASGKTYTSVVSFSRGLTQEGLAELLADDLKQKGLTSAKATGTRVLFNGLPTDPLKEVAVKITNNSLPAEGHTAGIKVTVTGD